MLKRYPLIVSCLVIGSLNFTTSSYAVRSIPWSSKRCGRSSYKKPTNRSVSTVDFGGLWSTRLSPMAHLEFWSALRAKLLFLKNWRGSLVVGLVELTCTAGIGRKMWWESWVLAICLGSSKFKWRGTSLWILAFLALVGSRRVWILAKRKWLVWVGWSWPSEVNVLRGQGQGQACLLESNFYYF